MVARGGTADPAAAGKEGMGLRGESRPGHAGSLGTGSNPSGKSPCHAVANWPQESETCMGEALVVPDVLDRRQLEETPPFPLAASAHACVSGVGGLHAREPHKEQCRGKSVPIVLGSGHAVAAQTDLQGLWPSSTSTGPKNI